jgi:hypothetical protein
MVARLTAGGVLGAAALGVAGLAALELYGQRRGFADRSDQNILFPPDLNRANAPFMSMQFKRYQRRSINEQPFYNDVMKIRLPVPDNLVERTSVSYDNTSLGSALGSFIEAQSAGGNIVNSLVTLGVGGAVGALGALPSLAGEATRRAGGPPATEAERAAENRRAGLAQGVVGAAGRALAVEAGALFGITANPYQVVLFKSPDFRTHSFAWKFIPNSLEESQILRNLIEVFKYHSLPGISSAGAVFFSYPEILEINFRPSDQFLYRFKPCVVKSVTTNFAPNSPSFVKSSGAPTAIEFKIELQEIEIMTKADFLRNEEGEYGILRGATPEQRAAGQRRFAERALTAPGAAPGAGQ